VTPCLRPDELVDLVEGMLPAERAAHAAACETCRAAAAELAVTWAETRDAEVPEPAPYFWTALSQRVRSAIDEASPRQRGAAWLGWGTVVPLAGMAALLMALAAAFPRPAPAPDRAAIEEPAVPIAPDVASPEPIDDALALVVALAGTLPETAGDALALAPLPDLGEVAAMALTDDELHALEQLLREAVDRPKS
jgi:hypothetical protein